MPMQARNLADEQVGETVPEPAWLYSRHTDAVRPLRTQGAQNIRTRGSLPHQRSNIRTWLSIAHHQFSACRSGGVHIRIYACSRTPGGHPQTLPLQSGVGPYMSQSSIFGAKSKNRVSEIQRLTDCQTLEKATLRQNQIFAYV